MSTATSAASSPAQPGPAERLRQVWAAARLDLLRLERGRHRLARLVLMGLPVLASAVVALVVLKMAEQPFSEVLVVGSGSRTPVQTLSNAVALLWPLMLRFCVFLAALDVFGGLFRGELSERTLHHVFLQPLRRETVTVGKFLAGLLVLLRLGVISWLLALAAWLLPHGLAGFRAIFTGAGLKVVFSFLLALVLALAAYGGIFLLAGMLSRGPVLVGAAIWIWEGLAAFLPASFQKLTVAYWINSLRPVPALGEAEGMLAMFRQDAQPAPALASIAACLFVGAVTTAAAAWWSRRLELSYGARD